ncbi:MAG TPA: sensor histidine kinase [Candidatus Limnocylindrales bacterium]|nr:sensor histidine kinase [Candidatus Limnocylindrales bacterium]
MNVSLGQRARPEPPATRILRPRIGAGAPHDGGLRDALAANAQSHDGAGAATAAALPDGVRTMLVEALEAERHHLARELHDEIGQILIAAKLGVETLRHAEGTPEFPTRVSDALALIVDAVHRVRALSIGLRPPLLESGLVSALTAAVGRLAVLNSIEIRLDADPNIPRLPPAVELTVFRVVQEAVINAQRHSHARTVQVAVWMDGVCVHACVDDNGCGFDVDMALERASYGQSMGLPAMRDRVEGLGGTFAIDSNYERGTRIEAWIPIET